MIRRKLGSGRVSFLPLCIVALLLHQQLVGFVLAFGPSFPRTLVKRPRSSIILLESSEPNDGTTSSKEWKEEEDDDATIMPTVATTATTTNGARRRVAKIEQFARLPVWPAWNGVFIFVVSRLFGKEIAAKVEDAIGGRVCPNFFNQDGTGGAETSPFIMLVHHRHSFFKWDPLRYFQKSFILPEGFPAHPHRGFTTVTYFMKGGFQHRDSMGIQQRYGALNNDGEEKRKSKYRHHTQWLFTGAGLLHEEMFDIPADSWYCEQELYQLWLNVPSWQKLDDPQTLLLGPQEAPHVRDDDNVSETVVISGTFQNQKSQAPSNTDIFHVTIHQRKGIWTHTLNPNHETVVIYMRKGNIAIDGTEIPVHHTAYLEKGGGNVLQIQSLSEGPADFFLLAGEPLREPVAAQGSMVMNSGNEINQAYMDYQMGKMGKPWDHTLSDEEWKEHVQEFPCIYRNIQSNYGEDEL